VYTPPLLGAAITDDTKPYDKALALRELELNSREHALDARQQTLEARDLASGASAWKNPLVLAIFAAAIGLIGNVVVAVANVYSNQAVEKQKLQSNLIVEGIKTTQENACKNLKFFLSLKLIDDSQDGATKKVCQPNSNDIPSLPPPGAVDSVNPTTPSQKDLFDDVYADVLGIVIEDRTSKPIEGVRLTTPELSSGVMTDKEGHFALPASAFLSTTHTTPLHAEKDGYLPADVQVLATSPSLTVRLRRTVKSSK
jgi:hypothetical protein